MRKLSILAILGVFLGVPLLASPAQAVTASNASVGWVQISSNAFGLPADLSGIGCGREDEASCEPEGFFIFNIPGSGVPVFTTSGAWNILNADGGVSDQIQYLNQPITGFGLVIFLSDPSLKNFVPAGLTLCTEVFAGPTDPGPGGCVAPFSITASDGTLITLTAASDSEHHPFDPFGLGADVSDALQITGGATVVPEPGTRLLFGTGLFGVASAIRRRVPR